VTSTSGLARRRRSAYAAALAAKQRRQKIFVIAGAVVLAGVLAYEIPHTLKLLGSHSSSSTSVIGITPSASRPPLSPGTKRLLRGDRRGADPFVSRGDVSQDTTAGPALPGRDPFQLSQAAPTAPAAPIVKTLPQQIVIGSPGKGRHARHGWIVILASIPTSEGSAAADRIARSARAGGLKSVSILNSSKSRPLRGGYWVVYIGPYPTLGAVVSRAAAVHSAGYRGAYIRELIVYR
jgi:hypothetical protein